ncbi:ABC transporter ATP-binding protein [Paenibacillus radicis (ex Gao et al. 2016)]|uniref:Carnitine transport ATP-binding protein OpuCA n=1 Tax=Paenibacillus radicis (ex Gao et al. 2016) TaxID=1737354 RepID=A0A917LTD1_9BACL|nr:ABC transporter ATP-binding protein [Paenibacillus radicis (ex Gao et al. 2016)]GGG54212.1 ABC transporter ATP-binding protein [Paenibacillus radicis (ex Gao et al. 2016)]
MSAYLELQAIRKQFGHTNVLNQINLQIREGELVTLLGPSGCGKSTLLRCIAGLADIDDGKIILDNKDIVNVPPRSREIGMVFQSYGLFPNMTVSENIQYGMKMRGASKEERRKRSEELLAMIDMEEKRGAYPQQLSGGQQQRVALARSLAVQPKVLLLDEPLSALDAKIRKSLRTEIREIQKRFQMTTIFVTHDQEEAFILSDRVCLMNKGSIVQEGSPEELYTRPKTEFVARFMGSYNVLTKPEALRLFGQVDSQAERFAVRPESVALLGGDDRQTALNEGKQIIDGSIESVSILGSIIRYAVNAADVKLTIDTLNDGRPLRQAGGGGISLALDRSQLLPLEKEGA